MKNRFPVWIALMFLVASLPGCGNKTGAPEQAKADHSASVTPALQPVLSAWQNGDQGSAVSNFVQVDWNSRPLFPVGSPLNLTEDEFRARVRSQLNPESVNALGTNLLAELEPLKRLAAAVGQSGQRAAAQHDYGTARRYFTALKQCGEAMDGTNSLGLLRLVGQGLRKRADIELGKLPQPDVGTANGAKPASP